MHPNEVATPAVTPAVPADCYPRHLDETKKLSFWVSQLFILLATVVGVYLASSQGFRQALAYGDIQNTRSNYYLRKSLRGELADNVRLVREYANRVKTGGLPARKEPFNLDTFVWESMKNSSATLETPPELLRESRMFYRGIADTHEKIVNNTFGVDFAVKKLNEFADHMEKEVLPQFDADMQTLRDSLAKRDVRVE